MILHLLNLWDAVRYRRSTGVWCSHPEGMEKSVLIDGGMRKMFWCGQCNGRTEFT